MPATCAALREAVGALRAPLAVHLNSALTGGLPANAGSLCAFLFEWLALGA